MLAIFIFSWKQMLSYFHCIASIWIPLPFVNRCQKVIKSESLSSKWRCENGSWRRFRQSGNHYIYSVIREINGFVANFDWLSNVNSGQVHKKVSEKLGSNLHTLIYMSGTLPAIPLSRLMGLARQSANLYNCLVMPKIALHAIEGRCCNCGD